MLLEVVQDLLVQPPIQQTNCILKTNNILHNPIYFALKPDRIQSQNRCASFLIIYHVFCKIIYMMNKIHIETNEFCVVPTKNDQGCNYVNVQLYAMRVLTQICLFISSRLLQRHRYVTCIRYCQNHFFTFLQY